MKFVFQCKHFPSEFYPYKISKYEHITVVGDNIWIPKYDLMVVLTRLRLLIVSN